MRISRLQIGLIAAVLVLAPLGAARGDDPPEGVEVDRDAAELQELLHSPGDQDYTDSALVFTNPSEDVGYVVCAGYDADGAVVGRIWLRVPAQGLRFALASDLSDDLDFIGSARCRTWPHVIGSAFLIRPGAVTDLPSRQLPLLHPVHAQPIPQAALEPAPGPGPTAGNGNVRRQMTRLRARLRHGIGFPVVATH